MESACLEVWPVGGFCWISTHPFIHAGWAAFSWVFGDRLFGTFLFHRILACNFDVCFFWKTFGVRRILLNASDRRIKRAKLVDGVYVCIQLRHVGVHPTEARRLTDCLHTIHHVPTEAACLLQTCQWFPAHWVHLRVVPFFKILFPQLFIHRKFSRMFLLIFQANLKATTKKKKKN